MNRDDALDVIAFIMACWPQAQSMTDETAQVWITKLEPHDLDDSVRAIEWLHERLDFPPSWAQFREGLRNAKPRTVYEPPALDAPPVPADKNLARMRRLRQITGGVGEHERHDRNPRTECPVCRRKGPGREQEIARFVMDGGPLPEGINP